MDHATRFQSRFGVFAVLLVVFLSFSSTSAATHTITFGSNFQYTPSQLNVAVGDVITWQGDFTMHPLQFDQVPTGATLPANVTSGSSFSYTVEVAGTYAYHCMLHGSAAGAGMAGTFTAETASVDRPSDIAMLRSFPNPIHKDSPLVIELGFDASLITQVSLTTIDGLCTIFNKGAGYLIDGNALIIPNTSWGAGTFVLSVLADGKVYRRKVMIVR